MPLKGQEEPLVKNVFDFIQQNCLVLPGDTVVVGVSGGPDSVCLLHILARLRERLGIKLYVAHLNHILRGAESEADAEYVSQLARQLEIAVIIERRDIKGYQKEHRLSLEEAAREVRYQFLSEVANTVGTNRVAVGHTADDQVETILMHLVRGSGIYGLQGMQPITELELSGKKRLILIRPLLKISRKQVETYCQEQTLSPREDSSNLSRSFLRNRIRYELMPLLQSYNPKVNEALLRTADTVAAEATFFEQQVSLIWDKVVTEEEGVFSIEAKEVALLPLALQRYLLREVVRRLLGNLKDIEWKHIEKMRAALSLPNGKQIVLPRGLAIYIENKRCRIMINPQFPSSASAS